MFTPPKTIDEWIDERVSFTSNYLSSIKVITDENKNAVSDFTITNENFLYCKKLYDNFKSDRNDIESKKLFKNIANKLIFDAVYELDKQEYKCSYYHGLCFPTKEKDILPQEQIDNIKRVRIFLEDIFEQVKQI